MPRLSPLFALCLALPAWAAPPCSARSGPERATFVELYTSEGCSSCPPAEQWLSGVKAGPGVVALAFHVDYWDGLGWRDPYSSPAFTARQYERMHSLGGRFVFTPQVMVDGRNWNAWRSDTPGGLPPAPAEPPGAGLALTASPIAGTTRVLLSADLSPGAPRPAVAYLARYESGLAVDVRGGENSGRRLRHDFVVRDWIGPLAFDSAGHASLERDFAAPGPGGVAAVVMTGDGRRILQALALPFCP